MKKLFLAALVLAACLVISSCSLADATLSLMGFDTHDYEAEEVLEVIPPDSDEADRLRDMVKMLTVNNPIIPEFSSAGTALSECRDAILNYMLCTGFAKYTGNLDLLEKAQAEYPGLNLLSVIPTEDFENWVYTYFGGNAKLSHRDSELFTYLDKASCYTSVTVPIESKITVDVFRCEKTERTYRLRFRCTLGSVTSPVYNALIINRQDGSSYFKSVTAERQ